MNQVETIFQFFGDTLNKLGNRLKISLHNQYKILLFFRICIAILIPAVAITATIYHDFFNLRPDTCTILSLASLAAGLLYFIGRLAVPIFMKKDAVSTELEAVTFDGKKYEEYLQERRRFISVWLMWGIILVAVIKFSMPELRLLLLALSIPAVLDLAIVLILICWECTRYEKTEKTESIAG